LGQSPGRIPAALHGKHPKNGKEELQRLAAQEDGLLQRGCLLGQGDEEHARQQRGIAQREQHGTGIGPPSQRIVLLGLWRGQGLGILGNQNNACLIIEA
jgi:hypothetical protein